MANIPNVPIWVDLFETLRELPELWKIKSDLFKDRNKKKKSWAKLLDVYKKIDPSANVDSLKKRLTNIKTCYRRELKKVEQSIRSGAGAKEEYVPSLWYFETINFLRDQEVQIPGISTINFEHVEVEFDQAEDATENMPGTSILHCYSQKRKKIVRQHMAESNELLKEALGQLNRNDKNNKDDANVFAKSWATSYRKISPTQQIYAKKAIEDILVLGQLNLLSLHSVNTPYSNNSIAPSTSSSPFPLHNSSLQSSESSTSKAFFQQPFSPPCENVIIIPEDCNDCSSVEQLRSGNSFT